MTAARREWATMGTLPITAMLGYAGSSCFTYSNGVLMTRITGEFGWTRAEFSTALTLQMVLGLLLGPLIGKLVDRIGSRRVALAAVVPYVGGYALLGLVGSPVWQWWMLCALQALLAAGMGAAVWVTIVARNFDASRGLAMAVALSGTGLSSAVWPILAATYLEHLDWRMVFGALALTWAVVVGPLLFFFFRDHARPEPAAAPQVAAPAQATPRPKIAFTPMLIKILIAGGLFAGVQLGMMLHLVPILQANGLDLTHAAQLAGVAGIGTIVGRVGIGFLIDRMSLRPLAIILFLLPVLVALLLSGMGDSYALAFLAAAILGVAAGGEIDIVLYAISRQAHPDTLGAINGIALSIFALCASLGPLIASATFDTAGNYLPYFYGSIPVVLVATALIASAIKPSAAAA